MPCLTFSPPSSWPHPHLLLCCWVTWRSGEGECIVYMCMQSTETEAAGLPLIWTPSGGIKFTCTALWEEPSFVTTLPFVACSTNVGEGLVKLITCNDVPGRWVDVWRVEHSLCTAVRRLSESKRRHQGCLMSSAQSFYGPCLDSVAYSLAVLLGMCYSSTCPGTSLHVISFARPSPMLVPQATKAGVRRPGYEARESLGKTLHIILECYTHTEMDTLIWTHPWRHMYTCCTSSTLRAQ